LYTRRCETKNIGISVKNVQLLRFRNTNIISSFNDFARGTVQPRNMYTLDNYIVQI